MATTLVTLATFFVVTGIVLSVYHVVSAESPASQRLKHLVPALSPVPRPGVRAAGALRLPAFAEQMLAGLGRLGFGSESALRRALSVAGFRAPNATLVFLGFRTLLSFGPALLILVSQVSSGKPVAHALGLAVLVWAFGHLLVNYWLKRRGRRRSEDITAALPDALDLMVVSLEAGLGLNQTISRVGDERASVNDALGQELCQVSLELRGGRDRAEALRALGERNGVTDLKALAGLIIQSERLGASMARTLRVHADLMRTKRRQRAEEAARKLPIKVLFPLALFILPALFIVVVGPAFLKLGHLMSVMTGR